MRCPQRSYPYDASYQSAEDSGLDRAKRDLPRIPALV
jgi:hypothetical protein